MRKLSSVFAFVAAFTIAAVPCFAGIHYQAVSKGEGAGAQVSNMQVEGWVSGPKARVEFKDSGNPVMKEGTYILTKDGGKTMYLVDPKEKTYVEWDLQGMAGMLGGITQGMGPLLKFQVSNPKVEKLAEEDGGTVAGQPTRHYRYRTSYAMTVKVFGMGNTQNIVTEQEIWATDKLSDVGLRAWLRSEPPLTGNAELDKLMKAEIGKVNGFPLKTVTVNTSTPQKGGKPTVTRTTMEVTQIDTNATVADSRFEIPAGFQETQIMPVAQ
ncbi:MAG TPA: DUF4412 domain-containing protein [Thermoanaerobaculia bacterium]|nr:DUF4412 domain-containing protein [Thermoanaerobaculia bacterium]